MENSNNFYNWGYGLCVAIDDDLPNAIPSANTMVDMLYKRRTGAFGMSSDYAEVTTLYNADATFENLIKSMLSLAAKTIPGDIVTIYFALHGMASTSPGPKKISFNTLTLFENEIFTEDELICLLRLFHEEVRVVLVMDICQSGTWLNEINVKDDCDIEKACDIMIRKSKNFECSQEFQDALVKLKPLILRKQLVAAVTVIGAISDKIKISDFDCFATFLRKTWIDYASSNSNLDFNMFELIHKVRDVATNVILEEKIGTTGMTRWKIYYKEYSRRVLGCPISDVESPEYDYKNLSHQKALLHFLPTIQFIGQGHEPYFFCRAFAVN